MEFKKNLVAIDKLVASGKFEEAVATYFTENATTSSPNDNFRTNSKSEKLESLQYFFRNVAKTNKIQLFETKVKGNVSESVFTFDFTNHQNENLFWHEAIRRVWTPEGLVISEEYVAISPEAAPAPAAAPKVEAKKTPAKAAKKTESSKDDLKLIEGIGPKIEELLHKAGITTFAILSNTTAEAVKEILAAAGKRYLMHDPKTWAAQAKLAAEGKMAELKQWQAELNGGK